MGPVSRSDLRKFGLTVGIAFALLGTVSWWRGHELPPRVLWTVGGGLAVFGLLAPSVLRPVHRGWMAFALVLGRVNTRIILTLLYYVTVTPIGIVMRLFRDPMNRALGQRAESQWIRRKPQAVDLAAYERQF